MHAKQTHTVYILCISSTANTRTYTRPIHYSTQSMGTFMTTEAFHTQSMSSASMRSYLTDIHHLHTHSSQIQVRTHAYVCMCMRAHVHTCVYVHCEVKKRTTCLDFTDVQWCFKQRSLPLIQPIMLLANLSRSPLLLLPLLLLCYACL